MGERKYYVERRVADGQSRKMEALRCLKRYIARETYHIIRKRNLEIARTKPALDCWKGIAGTHRWNLLGQNP